MKKTKKQFILDTLLPYKENPETCGYDGKNCMYLTLDGKKCALGKHMNDGDWQNNIGDAKDVLELEDYNIEDVLTPEALEQDLTVKEWLIIQRYHDNIATKKPIHKVVEILELKTGIEFPELKS